MTPKVYFIHRLSPIGPPTHELCYIYDSEAEIRITKSYAVLACMEVPLWLRHHSLKELIEMFEASRLGVKPRVRVKAG